MSDNRPPLAAALDLSPHPEGGWYRETWRSTVTFGPEGYKGPSARVVSLRGQEHR